MNIKKTLAASVLAGAMTVTAAAVPASAADHKGWKDAKVSKSQKFRSDIENKFNFSNVQASSQEATVDQEIEDSANGGAGGSGGDSIAIGGTATSVSLNLLNNGDSLAESSAEANTESTGGAGGNGGNGGAAVNVSEVNQESTQVNSAKAYAEAYAGVGNWWK